MKEYHKIEGLYKRDELTKKLILGEYRSEAVAFLSECQWEFTEKIDGTNIRIHWDGHRVEFAGRTDKASIPNKLMEYLETTFGGEVNEQVFEEHFGDKDVILFGEGYGAKIQNGGDYRPDNSFILFDVMVEDVYLRREDVENVARYFGIDVVPVVLTGTIREAVDFVKNRPSSTIGKAKMEGLVGRPKVELCTRSHGRVIVKIKVRDMMELGTGGMKDEKRTNEIR